MKLKIQLFPSSDRVRRIVTGVFVALLLAIPGSYVVCGNVSLGSPGHGLTREAVFQIQSGRSMISWKWYADRPQPDCLAMHVGINKGYYLPWWVYQNNRSQTFGRWGEIGCPLAVLPALVAPLVAILWWPVFRDRRFAHLNPCRVCGYSMVGLPRCALCPECGRADGVATAVVQ